MATKLLLRSLSSPVLNVDVIVIVGERWLFVAYQKIVAKRVDDRKVTDSQSTTNGRREKKQEKKSEVTKCIGQCLYV